MEPFTLREGPVAVRPLRPQDAPLLLTWMQNPQVLAFYGGRDMAYTPEKIQEDFYAPEEGARRCLVEFEGAPVGYIQIYQLDAQLCHIIASGMFNGIFEIVVHDMPKEQAMRYVDQLRDFYTAGWLKLIGQ